MSKISELPALTTPVSGDLCVVVDISDTTGASTGTTKRMTYAELRGPAGPAGPAGTNGTNGTNGTDGQDGVSATVTVGTTTTGVAGTNAIVSQTGTPQARTFNFTIPRGDTGAQGPAGAAGAQGPAGAAGATGPAGPIGPASNVTQINGISIPPFPA